MDSIKEEVRAASDIAEIVRGYVALRRRGEGFVGLCPFHTERTPSFYVTPDRGTFKCFGCDKGGDVFAFVMEMESLTFPEALRNLAKRANIQLPQRGRFKDRARLMERNAAALQVAAEYFQKQLHESQEANVAVDALNAMQLTRATAEAFGLGYAPRSGSGLVEAAGRGQIAPEAMKDANLLRLGDDAAFRDRWSGQLTFPIHTKTGRIAGIAACGAENETEERVFTLAFNKRLESARRVLYGLSKARAAIRTHKEVLLVEHITDVLAMHQAGLDHAVAPVGGSMTPEQAQLLKPLARKLVVIHDGQPAAVRSAIRTIHAAMAQGLYPYDVSLPQGAGPATVLAKDSVKTLQMLLKERTDPMTFLHAAARGSRPGPADESPNVALSAVANALVNVKDELLRSQYVEQAASLLAVDSAAVEAAVDRAQDAHVLQVGMEFFQDRMMHSPEGARARRMLEQDFGVRNDTVQQFGLGYAPEQWDGLKNAGRARGLDEAVLHDAGLLVVKQRDEGPWYFDRFRGRVVLPVHSVGGYVAGFWAMGARAATVENRFSARPESTDFDGADHLYGMQQCRAAARKRGELLIVRGYLDVLALHAAGFGHVVAPVGQNLTEAMVDKIRPLVSRLVLIYADRTMQPDHVLQDINTALRCGLGADVVSLPSRDCRTLLRKGGTDALQVLLEDERCDFVDFIYEDGHNRGLLTDAGGLDAVRGDVKAMVEGIADPATRKHYAERAARIDRNERMYDALAFAGYFFQRQLGATREGGDAARYLKGRRLNAQTVKDFGLGYAPDRWDALLKAAARTGISAETLEDAGLVKPSAKGRRSYDRFRGRVMFPIRSEDGDIIGFGGRILKGGDEAPKYLNSPEPAVYKKSRALYGLYECAHAANEQRELILVEGYTDVLALHQVGITNAVACCGTALTSGQISVLRRYADRLILLYDADEAGARAALRAIDLALEGGMRPFAASLPAGEDPDSYVRKQGAAALREYLARHGKNFVAFFHDHFARQGRLGTPEEKADASHTVLTSIAKISDEQRREGALQRASAVFGVPLDVMRKALAKKAPPAVGRRAAPDPAKRQPAAAPPRDESRRVRPQRSRTQESTLLPAEELLLELMVKNGEPMVRFIMKSVRPDEFSAGVGRRLAVMLEQGHPVSKSALAEDPELDRFIRRLKQEKPEPSPGWTQRNMGVVRYGENQQANARSAIKQLRRQRRDERVSRLQERLRTAAPAEQPALLAELNSIRAA